MPIHFTTGNLLASDAEALVNTVNTVGVMGKGIALQFREQFPQNADAYKQACKAGKLAVGHMLIFRERKLNDEKWIINFPTKQHWRGKSRIEWIEAGLAALARELESLPVGSVALPPLGCGNGGLNWQEVRPLIESYLGGARQEIEVYQPSEAVRERLNAEDRNKDEKLTDARAMMLRLMFAFEELDADVSLFSANKLAWFLQRAGEKKLNLKFEPWYYGPYSDQLRHLLYRLQGSWLTGMAQKAAPPFEPLRLFYERRKEVDAYISGLPHAKQERLENVLRLIEGFESNYSIELLATVDFVTCERRSMTTAQIESELRDKWPARKTGLFPAKHIDLARERLSQYSDVLLFGQE